MYSMDLIRLGISVFVSNGAHPSPQLPLNNKLSMSYVSRPSPITTANV